LAPIGLSFTQTALLHKRWSNHSWVNFTDDELQALVTEAHRLGHRVAAHAIGWEGIDAALRPARIQSSMGTDWTKA